MGVDACPKGWVAVRLHLGTHRLEASVIREAEQLFAISNTRIIAIDIPIGLPDAGPRGCDALAREQLGPRRSSVFPAPVRPALRARSRPDASRITFARDGRKVSCQAFALYDKIAAVDEVLRTSPEIRHRVFEVHPEVSFWAWNRFRPMTHRKKRREGKLERESLIRERYGSAGIATLTDLRERYWCHEVGDDDIHDAFAALWTAERINSKRFQSFPDEPAHDAVGLPMRIVF